MMKKILVFCVLVLGADKASSTPVELLVSDNEAIETCELMTDYGGDIIFDEEDEVLKADFYTYLFSNTDFKRSLVGQTFQRFVNACGARPFLQQRWVFREDLSLDEVDSLLGSEAVMAEIELACETDNGKIIGGYFRVDRTNALFNCYSGSLIP